MPLDFPSSPSVGQIYPGTGAARWQWDGAKWTPAAGAALAPLNSPVFTGDPQAPAAPYGDNDASLATTSFVQGAAGPGLNNFGRNFVHNGRFAVNQRAAGAVTIAGPNYWPADRWVLAGTGDTVSIQQMPLGDAGRTATGDDELAFYIQNNFTGNSAAGSFHTLDHRVEGVRRLANKTVILSFYANAGAAGLSLGVSMGQNMGTGGSPSANVPIAGQKVPLTTSLTRYALTFVLPSLLGMTLGTNGNDYTSIRFWYSSGATNNAASGGVGVQSGLISITGVQLEIAAPGQTQPTPLEKRDPMIERALCQRFFQSSELIWSQYGLASNGSYHSSNLPVPMRAAPTIATAGVGLTNCATLSVGTYQGGPGACSIYMSVIATATGGFTAIVPYTLSADL
jgi:hypothetical protein